MKTIQGRIFNIQKFSVHDGPGIRDVVFMKGCPLRCKWCANPESQVYDQQIRYRGTKCISCLYCVKLCPEGAIQYSDKNKIEIDYNKCTMCEICALNCCSQALSIAGEDITVEDTICRTHSLSGAWRSNGGITVSGGEPLMQAEFVTAFLKECYNRGTHTAIETCGYANWEDLKSVAKWCKLVYFDVKLLNSEQHKYYTGQDNKRILDNLIKLREEFPDLKIIVRTPVIPNVNDNENALTVIAEFLRDNVPNINDFELMPFHNLAVSKYKQFGIMYDMENIQDIDKNKVKEMERKLKELINLNVSKCEGV